MRTTVTLDDDVAALIESERLRTGESFREAINRLLRRAARQEVPAEAPLPLLDGRPLLDVSDVSALLAALDEERRAERGLT
jgi:phytoene/squalene synthetase